MEEKKTRDKDVMQLPPLSKDNSRQQPKSKLKGGLSIERGAIFSLLKQLAIENEAYFQQLHLTSHAKRIAECCQEISVSSDVIEGLVDQLQQTSRKYDYDEHTPGNGFRSLICVTDVVLLRLISLLRNCSENRSTLMFRVYHYCKEVEAYGAVLRFLTLAFYQLISMISMLGTDSLFPPLASDYEQFNGIFKGIESLDSSCFYGRLFGFQFAPSVIEVFRVIGVALAAFSLSWDSRSTALGSLVSSGKFLLNPEQRAARIIKVTREADIEFCRSFWNLSELPSSKLFCPSMAVCEKREIGPSGPLQIEALDGSLISIPEPSAHTGVRPISVKVLSVSHRVGLSRPNVMNRLPKTPCLVIHCHGGGYVATSSKSHETYLRGWAKALNCPIISIDYSLAPENPFPRATEEVLYAYAWIMQNPETFGWTGEKVCMVGDSAGGNLIVSVNLRLVELGAKRLPDGIVPIYTPFLFQYLPSPSRVLSFMDPLLHMGVVIRCAAAYTNSQQEQADGVSGKSCAGLETSVDTSKQHLMEECFDRVQNVDVEEEMSGNETMQTIRVDEDPSCVFLSSTNFDSDLIDYMEMHPLTKRSIHRSHSEASSSNMGVFEEANSEASVGTFDFCTSLATDGSTRCFSTPAASMSQKSTRHTGKGKRFASSAGRVQDINKKSLHRKGRSLSQSFVDTASLVCGHAYDSVSDWLDVPKTPVGHVDKEKLERALIHTTERVAEIQLEEAESHKSHFTELLKLKLPRNYLMSPLYAPDDLLKKLPPLRFVACHLDPLLDDTICFARRVRDAGGSVLSVDLLDSLPHGFLNFAPMSSDCQAGANACLRRIKEILDM